jgi:glycosyltransferase involved in cell wall biosynthesis
MKPLISIIVTSYNKAPYLGEAIQSILNQTYQNWETLIVDDGSTDHTEVVAKRFCDADARITYYKKLNGGASSARNLAFNHIKGKYVQFLDGDDVIDPTKFEKQIDLIADESDNIVCISDYFCSDEHDLSAPSKTNRYKSPVFETTNYLLHLVRDWEKTLSIPIHTFLFDSSFFLKNKIRFDESLVNHEDWDCWLQIFSKNPKVIYLDEKLATYRISSTAMCADYEAMQRGHLKAIKKNISFFKKQRHLKEALQKKYYAVKYGKEFENKKEVYRYILHSTILGIKKKLYKMLFR